MLCARAGTQHTEPLFSLVERDLEYGDMIVSVSLAARAKVFLQPQPEEKAHGSIH
jgi:hypothetical protein